MGYFDALARYSLTTAPDGRRLFFPWGVMGRGYVIGSELDYERLRRQTKISLIVAFALVFISPLAISKLALPRYLFGFMVAAEAVAMGAWMQYLLRGLASPAERLSRQESVTLQARGRSPASLRWPMIGSIAFVALGVILLAIDPAANWLLATVTIIFFGLCAVVSMFMLVVRQWS
jgi:hypothetical protein